MIEDRMEKALCEQIKWELYSSYLYLSMSAYFSSISLPGFAHWMKTQAQEELLHAMKFYEYVIGRGGKVILLSIDQPKSEWESPKKVFEDVYAHEQKVTGLINGLVDLATSEKDYATINMLQWFVAEQVQEESTAEEILQKVKLVSEEKGMGVLYMLDRDLSQRPLKLQEVITTDGGG
jgi:ferritin